MQTWILDENFAVSASKLSLRHLQAQIYEGIQILASLLDYRDKLVNPKRSVANHPASIQWKGYEFHLSQFVGSHLKEWFNRGYKSEVNLKNYENLLDQVNVDNRKVNEKVFNLIPYHKARLFFKMKDLYREFEGIEVEEIYITKSAFVDDKGNVFVK